MTWETSDRRQRLPPDWPQRRKAVLERDGHACQWPTGTGVCGAHASDVDHIVRGDDHELTNLRALCTWHHARKTAAEGNAARTRYSSRRPPEPHPGLRR